MRSVVRHFSAACRRPSYTKKLVVPSASRIKFPYMHTSRSFSTSSGSGETHYSRLGVNQNASTEEIKAAFRQKAKEYHPDTKKSGTKASAEEEFKKLNESYKILSDPKKRQEYDWEMKKQTEGQNFGGHQEEESEYRKEHNEFQQQMKEDCKFLDLSFYCLNQN